MITRSSSPVGVSVCAVEERKPDDEVNLQYFYAAKKVLISLPVPGFVFAVPEKYVHNMYDALGKLLEKIPRS